MSHLSTPPSGRRRPTLGLLTANIHLGVAANLWTGVTRAARRHDLDLICFPGDELTMESPRHAVYELVGTRRLDALICWSSALGLPVKGAAAERLLGVLDRLPAVSLNRSLGDHPTLSVDGFHGMCEAVSHLIEVHGRRRLAFLHGPTTHPDSAERYRAYVYTLRRHGIPVDPRLVSAPTEFRMDAGTLAFQVMLDVRGVRPGKDFDGLVACSDVLASDALRVLADRGVSVPDEVAVTGFNDSLEASTADPPLTSVSMPFDRLGERAVEHLAARLDGRPGPETSPIPTPLVVRRSCGCAQSSPSFFPAGRQDHELIARNLRALGTALITTTDLDGLSKTLAERLPSVGIPECWIALYEPSGRPAPTVRLVFACHDTRLRTPDLRPYPASLLVPEELLSSGRRRQWVVEPLHVGDEHFGFAVFDADPTAASVIRAVGDQISAALKGIGLYREVLRARDLAERADRAKTALLTAVRDELRTPLYAILRHTSEARTAAEAPVDRLAEIEASAEHQLAVINDLLDLSDLELAALDPAPELVNPGRILHELFEALVPEHRRGLDRHLDIPPFLPLVRADPRRLRQALRNVFTTADRLTPTGSLAVSTEVEPARIRFRFTCSESTIPRGSADDIFDPFVASRLGAGHHTGLALTVARRIIALHHGNLTWGREQGGDVFTVSLPLPTPDPDAVPAAPRGRHLVVVGDPPPPVVAWIEAVDADGRLKPVTAEGAWQERTQRTALEPVAVVWAPTGPVDRAECALLRTLVADPAFAGVPFLWFDSWSQSPAPRGSDLATALRSTVPGLVPSTIGLLDHDARHRERLTEAFRALRPDVSVLALQHSTALEVLTNKCPDAFILTDAATETDPFDALDRIRCLARLQDTFVLVLLSRPPARPPDRGEPNGRLVVAGDGILTPAELLDLLERETSGRDRLSPATRGALFRAVVYLQRHYHVPITRRRLASVAGISEDYLSRTFHALYGIGPWEYLNRLRIHQAKARLASTEESVQTVARKVGFRDRAYFSRTFRRLTGRSPQAYRAAGGIPEE